MCDAWKERVIEAPAKSLPEVLEETVGPFPRKQLFQMMDAAVSMAISEILFLIKDTEADSYQSLKYKLNSRIIQQNRKSLERAGLKIHENNCEIVLT